MPFCVLRGLLSRNFLVVHLNNTYTKNNFHDFLCTSTSRTIFSISPLPPLRFNYTILTLRIISMPFCVLRGFLSMTFLVVHLNNTYTKNNFHDFLCTSTSRTIISITPPLRFNYTILTLRIISMPFCVLRGFLSRNFLVVHLNNTYTKNNFHDFLCTSTSRTIFSISPLTLEVQLYNTYLKNNFNNFHDFLCTPRSPFKDPPWD